MKAHLSHALHEDWTIEDFPALDNRDPDTTWIWLSPNLLLEVDREFADRLFASFVDNDPQENP